MGIKTGDPLTGPSKMQDTETNRTISKEWTAIFRYFNYQKQHQSENDME